MILKTYCGFDLDMNMVAHEKQQKHVPTNVFDYMTAIRKYLPNIKLSSV